MNPANSSCGCKGTATEADRGGALCQLWACRCPRGHAARRRRAGRILDLPSEPTLSDGTAGGIEAGAITFPLCQALIDEFVLVTEDDIRKGLRLILDEHHMVVEGAAAVAVSALLQLGNTVHGRTVAVVLCGANIDSATLRGIV